MNAINQFVIRWKTEYDYKTYISAAGSLMVTLIFAFYNGYLGLHHASLWYGTICVYYIMLTLLRGSIIAAAKRISQRKAQEAASNHASLAISFLLLILNISLIVPVSIMVKQQKPVSLTLIPAIAMAAYTTYKVVMASVHLRRRKTTSDSLVWLLRTISFIDALVSILTVKASRLRASVDIYSAWKNGRRVKCEYLRNCRCAALFSTIPKGIGRQHRKASKQFC